MAHRQDPEIASNPPIVDRTQKPPASAWAWPVTWIAIVSIAATAGLYVFKSLRDLPGETAHKTTTVISDAGKQLIALAEAFNQGTITTTFISYASSLNSSHYLQFATLRQAELFSRSDQASTAFGYIPLPEVIVEARAPVEYTYHLDLNAKWELRVDNGVLYVLAPRIRFNKPAVDASRIEYDVRKGSVFRNGEEAKQHLKESITFLASRKAQVNVPLVRELGRKKTEEFIENWLAKSYLDGERYPVKVFFPGEILPLALERHSQRTKEATGTE